MIHEVIVSLFLLGGVGLILIAALGALRFGDVLTRMAAVSKASTLGLTLLFLAVIVESMALQVTLKAIATIAMLWLSAPMAAHLVGRAAILKDEKLKPTTQGLELIDEIKKNVE